MNILSLVDRIDDLLRVKTTDLGLRAYVLAHTREKLHDEGYDLLDIIPEAEFDQTFASVRRWALHSVGNVRAGANLDGDKKLRKQCKKAAKALRKWMAVQ